MERWVWRPSACMLPRWDAKRFCRVLDGRRLMFIGDSIMEQVASSIMALVRNNEWPLSEATASCLGNIRSGPSDTLLGFEGDRGIHWKKLLREHRPHIAV